MVYPPQGFAGLHASTHQATGFDPITGWINPTQIGPISNVAAGFQLRTRNIAGNYWLDHYFEPLDDAYGRIGRTISAFSMIIGKTIYAVWGYAGGGYCYQEWLPYIDNLYSVGNDNFRWKRVRAVEVVTGELGFEEVKCVVCGETFKPQESIVLKIIEANGKNIITVPVHVQCNPHTAKLNPEEAKPPRLSTNLKEGEFTIIGEEAAEEEHLLLRARFWDNTLVAFPVPADADEETIINTAERYYNLQKQREQEQEEIEKAVKAKKRRDWLNVKLKLKMK